MYCKEASQFELEKKRETFASAAEFREACKQRPEEMRIYHRYYNGPQPDLWQVQKFGEWPPGGLLFLFCRFYSVHFSTSNRSHDKHCLLGKVLKVKSSPYFATLYPCLPQLVKTHEVLLYIFSFIQHTQ